MDIYLVINKEQDNQQCTLVENGITFLLCVFGPVTIRQLGDKWEEVRDCTDVSHMECDLSNALKPYNR